MKHNMHPNSLANLNKRKKFTSEDGYARECAKKSAEAKRSIAEEMRAYMDEPDEQGKVERRKNLAKKLIRNMEKSPQWFELGLKMLGEMPTEEIKVEVNAGDCEATKKMIAELKNHVAEGCSEADK